MALSERPRGLRRNIDLDRDVVVPDGRAQRVPQLHEQTIGLTLRADGITKTGGRPAVVAALLAKFEGFYDALGGNAWMTGLEFGNSVTVTLEPVIDSRIRDEAVELAEDEPGLELDPVQARRLVPDSIVAAVAAAAILEAEPEEAVELAGRYGAAAAHAFVQFAKAVEKADGEAVLKSPGLDKPTKWSSRKAARVVERSKVSDDEAPFEILVKGRLTRADSEEEELRVVLSAPIITENPAIDGRRKVVEGGYSGEAQLQVQRDSLWDSDVVARVTVYPIQETGKSRPTVDSFVFTDIRKDA